MTAEDARRPADDPVRWLLQVAHELPPAELPDAVSRAIAALGGTWSAMYLVDHDQQHLQRFPGSEDAGDAPPSFDIDGTTAGRAFAWERTHTVAVADGVRVWVPLIDGTARLGVLAVDIPADLADDRLAGVQAVASLAAELLISKAHYTDAIEMVRRQRPMTLAAELQRSMLPPVALVTPLVAVAGILQPAYEVAGDSFDYALNPDGLDVAIIDSVGHDLSSSLISQIVQGSLRNSRRCGLDLPAAYATADEALGRHYPDQRFATAAFGRLDPRSGLFRWISAGHPPPLVVRGSRVVGEAPTVPVVPIGLGGEDPPVNEVVLEPGDALVLYTDGVTEGGVRGGERFGLDRFVDLLGRAILSGLPPAELLRRVVTAVLEHTAYELHDDTTIVLVQRRAVR